MGMSFQATAYRRPEPSVRATARAIRGVVPNPATVTDLVNRARILLPIPLGSIGWLYLRSLYWFRSHLLVNPVITTAPSFPELWHP